MKPQKIVSRCGVVCSDCYCYPETCSGCSAVEGKVFWLEEIGETVCSIYSCCTDNKQLPHCGHCVAVPCTLYDREDPNMSHEENQESLRKRLDVLREMRNSPGSPQPKHLFSETALWKTKAEFTDHDGNVIRAVGESKVEVTEDAITNKSWALTDVNMLENNYTITPLTHSRFKSVSENPAIGTQEGYMDVAGPRLYSKFFIRGTELSGFEVITREGDTCHARGALYNGDDLINTWTAKMTRQ